MGGNGDADFRDEGLVCAENPLAIEIQFMIFNGAFCRTQEEGLDIRALDYLQDGFAN